MLLNFKYWRNSVIILDSVKYEIPPETEMEFHPMEFLAKRDSVLLYLPEKYL